jgi:hypothetical protein
MRRALRADDKIAVAVGFLCFMDAAIVLKSRIQLNVFWDNFGASRNARKAYRQLPTKTVGGSFSVFMKHDGSEPDRGYCNRDRQTLGQIAEQIQAHR